MSSRRLAPCAVLSCVAGLACSTPDVDEASRTGGDLHVTVTVDPASVRAVVPPLAFGMHTSVYDNAFADPDLPDELRAAGIRALRYPGGGYSDNYHWWNHSITPWQIDGAPGYIGPNTDFGSFVSLLESFDGEAIITVNYGSNLAGTGPGEPEEAAAWVAYANGDPASTHALGVDSSGKDWQTVGYWASLRASAPLAVDDGLNFLRISEPEPLGIEYWEIGNELFGNGYYGTNFEQDLHVPYDTEDLESRRGHEALSPAAYGQGVLEFASAMRAVDPTIKIGAVLNTPPMDYSWGPDWNPGVLEVCGREIDFGIVHWYPATTDSGLVRAPRRDVAQMAAELASSFETHGGENGREIEVLVTEMGPAPGYEGNARDNHAVGIFAADGYMTLIEHGVVNVDWLELHNGTFLAERSDRKGPAYKGIQMAHQLAEPGDALIAATPSDSNVLAAHAASRADGSTTIMLVNPSRAAAVQVTLEIAGAPSWSSGVRYDFGPAANGVSSGEIEGPTDLAELGPTLAVTVPAYTVTNLILTP